MGGAINLANRIDQRILVTGGTKRVGKVIADDLESAGAHVYRSSRADGDLADAAGCERVIASAFAALGGLDGVVLSASIFKRTPLEEVTAADVDKFIAVNLRSVFLLALFASKKMDSGAIVVIGDGATARPGRNYLPYNVSKAALRPLVENLALELAPRIRVNMVSPGTILPPEGTDEAALEKLKRIHPLQKIGRPENILPAVRDCLTNDFLTGVEIRVDGGKGL